MRGHRWAVAVVLTALVVGPGMPDVQAAGGPSITLSPAHGLPGAQVRLAGTGFTPGAQMAVGWLSEDGKYKTKADKGMVTWSGVEYQPAPTLLGRAVADSQGRIAVAFTAPEDLWGPHQVAAVLDGRQVAQADFHVEFGAAMTPTSGPVGTPIEVVVHGMAPAPWNTSAIRYDNRYLGFVSAVTTRGVARARFRAAGAPGPHAVQFDVASAGTPYLNPQQGAGCTILHLCIDRTWTFTVTAGGAVPPNRLEWPDPARVARLSQDAARAMVATSEPAQGVSLAVTPAAGPVLSTFAVAATGLPGGSTADIVWATMGAGNRMTGMSPVVTNRLVAAAAKPDGSLARQLTVPDDLGGWHMLQLVQHGKVLASAPYFVQRSLVAVAPARVKPGERFKVEIKGIGWTELDNGVAVTYDNGYEGYACGFNSRGDVAVYLTATGGPGVHLIDLYPMIYEGKDRTVLTYQVPHLTVLDDGPGLALGYALPVFRLAVVVAP
ncbi:MAG TPA: hypothetical protein VFL28_14055 [bacterium]|nr:hypothetical protein [bacterium]